MRYLGILVLLLTACVHQPTTPDCNVAPEVMTAVVGDLLVAENIVANRQGWTEAQKDSASAVMYQGVLARYRLDTAAFSAAYAAWQAHPTYMDTLYRRVTARLVRRQDSVERVARGK